MTGKFLARTPIPFQVRRPDMDDDDEEELNRNCSSSSSSREKELQIVSLSPPFRLPDDWLVEKKPRPSNPSHVDKYYYEPGTGRKFRSLASVQRYLTGDTNDYNTTERIISQNENTTYIEPGTGQRFRSLRSVERYLTGENERSATPKSVVKPSTRKQNAPGVKSCLKAIKKRSSVAEDKITLKALKLSIQSKHSEKSDSGKKINTGKDNRASIHNLSRPPAKVSWVLSGPGGFWSPFLDDSIVSESEKLKWSEAFVLSIHNGVINEHNS